MIRALSLLLFVSNFSTAADQPTYSVPNPTKSDEPVLKEWSMTAAANYLDGVGVNWTRDRQCITCHTNMPYLFARPFLKTSNDEGWKEVRQFLEDDVSKWMKGGKPRGDAYVVATAAALAINDRNTTGKLNAKTKFALDQMWSIQKKTGEWNWLKCNWPPMEHDDYFGAVLAAVAVGCAPEQYAKTDAAIRGIEKLKLYFAKNRSPDLHHQALLLWASQNIDGLMSNDEKSATIRKLKELQCKDGGWSLASLGKYVRHDQSPQSSSTISDGYGTGFVIFILRQAGVSATDQTISNGLKWLKSHQRESGRWFTRSLSNDKVHYITNAGTAYAVMALEACGELKSEKKE